MVSAVDFELRAVYSVPELARMAGISTGRMTRLLTSGHVEISRAGRLRVVLLEALREAMPLLWASIVRRAAESKPWREDDDE